MISARPPNGKPGYAEDAPQEAPVGEVPGGTGASARNACETAGELADVSMPSGALGRCWSKLGAGRWRGIFQGARVLRTPPGVRWNKIKGRLTRDVSTGEIIDDQ